MVVGMSSPVMPVGVYETVQPQSVYSDPNNVPSIYTPGEVPNSASRSDYPSFAGNISYDVLGSQYRGLGSSWFNAVDVAKENFYRDQVAKDYDLYRNLYSQRENNQFNADQSALQRAHELYMSNTQYSRAVEDLKRAGINPNLLLSGSSGASSSSSSAARSGSGSYGSSGYSEGSQDSLAQMVGNVLSLVGNVLQIKAGKIPKKTITYIKKL